MFANKDKPQDAAAPKQEQKQDKKPTKLYVLHQALEGSGTSSIYGTYTDQKSAERHADMARASAGLTVHREARYFVQEIEADEVAIRDAGTQPTNPPPTPGAQATPVPGVTVSEYGEALNVPNKQLKADEDDPHTRGLPKPTKKA